MAGITQDTLDSAADILWFIKGMIHQAQVGGDSCPFGGEHVQALIELHIMGAKHVHGDVPKVEVGF